MSSKKGAGINHKEYGTCQRAVNSLMTCNREGAGLSRGSSLCILSVFCTTSLTRHCLLFLCLGVTSEGVVVYLDEALRNVNKIDPHKQPFTIKITGGPDGDVRGLKPSFISTA